MWWFISPVSEQFWNAPYTADSAFESNEQWFKEDCENRDYTDEDGVEASHIWIIKTK